MTELTVLDHVAAVIVLYNSASVIEGCLASIPQEVEVVLVDNDSADDGAERARRARPKATIVRSPRNLGFGGGCNLGWSAASRPYIAFINPDVRLRAGALETLVARLRGEPRGMVGPAMLESTGASRRCKRGPSVALDVCGLLPAASRWAPVGWDGKLASANPVHTAGGPVPSLEGACLMVARGDLEAVGGFDEDFFLYYEEDSLALRLVRIGGRLIYEPRAQAEHAGAVSTNQVRTLAVREFHRSRVIFYRKRDGELRGRLAGVLLALAVLIASPSAAVNAALVRRRHTTPAELWLILGGIAAGLVAPLRSGISYAPGGAQSQRVRTVR